MAENLIVNKGSKEGKYVELIPQLNALMDEEAGIIANLANISAALKETFNFLWVGFYEVHNEVLRLGPFQGPIACTIIHKGKGVCGDSWLTGKSIIVEDVEQYPGHIACSSLSKSEIVLPIVKNNEVLWVLDVDSEHPSYFNAIDEKYLTNIVAIIEELL